MDELLKTSIHPYFFCVYVWECFIQNHMFYAPGFVCDMWWGKTDKTGGLLWGAGRPVSQHNLRDDSQKSHKTCSSGICRFYSFFIRWRRNIKNCLFSGFQSVSPSFTWNELYWQPASPLFLTVYCSSQMLKKIQFWFFLLAIWRDHWQLQTEKRRREAKYGFAGPGAGCLSDKVSFQQLLFLYNVFCSK